MAKEVRRLDIVFKDASATFKAGDVVSGHVILELGQDLKLKGGYSLDQSSSI